MEEKRTTGVWIVVAVLLLLPVLYVGSYGALVYDRRVLAGPGEEFLGIDLDPVYRIDSRAVEAFYQPIHAAHGRLRIEIHLRSQPRPILCGQD